MPDTRNIRAWPTVNACERPRRSKLRRVEPIHLTQPCLAAQLSDAGMTQQRCPKSHRAPNPPSPTPTTVHTTEFAA